MKRGQGIKRTVERLEIWKGFEAQRSIMSQQVSLFKVVAFQSKYSSMSVNVSIQARVANSFPCIDTWACNKHQTNRIFSFFIPFPIPWGVIISKQSTEIIT